MLLARAIAGRRMTVIGNDTPRAYVDGDRIFVPVHLPEAQLRDTVAVHASLSASGSFDSWVLTRLTGRRSVRLRYLTFEAIRCSPLLPASSRLRVCALYGGPHSTSPRDSLRRAVEEPKAVPEAPEWLGTIKPVLALRANSAGAAPTDDEQAGNVHSLESRELDDEEDSERSRILELLSGPLSDPLAEMLRKFLGSGRSPTSDDGGGQDMPVGGSRNAPAGDRAKAVPGGAQSFTADGVPIGHRYPEWDRRRARYRPDWCAVAEYDPPVREPAGDLALVPDMALRRQLARLGLTYRRHRRQASGDDLDLTALVELMADRAAGQNGDPRVFESNLRTAHDLGVLVLLDASGSTAESSARRPVFEGQRELAGRLTAALEELGDRVATYGFMSRGRDSVRFLRVKDFDDRFDRGAQVRLAALNPSGYTRLGAAVRHGSALLTARAGTSKLLMVVIGDGYPYDDDDYKDRHAQDDCQRALREAVARGIGCVCLNVGATTEPDVIERVWGDMPHRSLDEPEQLAGQVLPLFREAIRNAEASRRSLGREPGAELSSATRSSRATKWRST